MSTNEQTRVSQPTSAVRNTLGKVQVPQELAEKVHQEKVQQDKLKAVKARLNFEETSQYSESGAPSRRRSLKERLGSKHARNMFGSPEPRRGNSESLRKGGPERRTVYRRLEKGVFHRLGDKGKGTSAYSNDSKHRSYHSSRRDTESCYQSSRSKEMDFVSEKRHNKRTSSRRTEVLSESEETYPFTPRIRYFDFPKTRMPSHIKTYDGSKDPEDHLKIFQAAAKTERWVMPTWCHMFNSTLTENARVWYKLECRDVKGAPECMKIFGYMHEITNPELIKRLHDKIPKSVDEMMKVTTKFLKREVAASSRERKKSFPSWKQQDAGQKQNFKKGGFWNQQRPERKQDISTLLTKTPKEILALDKGKFKPSSPMTTPVEKRNASKFCEFHGEVEHTTYECMHLKRQIEEMLKAGKLVAKQKITQTFSPESVISFPPLGEEDGTEGPMIIEAEMGGHFVHRVYVDEDRRRGTFNVSMDELHDRKVTISIQRHNKEAGSKGNPGSTVYSSRNAKIPTVGGTVTLRSSRIILLECTTVSGPGVPQPVINQVAEEKIQVAEYSKQTIAIGSTLTEERRKELWISKPVMVKKHDDNWRMCVDFKDLNKVCPKDGYPLPKIDWKPCIARSENKLHSNRKVDNRPGKRQQATKKIFQAHTIVVITDQPIKQILSNPKVAGRLLKWSFELGEHDIPYRSRTSVKGQILADLIVERPEDDSPDTPMEDKVELPDPWILFTDGLSCTDALGAGLILTNPEGIEFTYALRFRFKAINNEAEYEALIAGLRIAEQMGVKNLQAHVDSRLVANQVNGSYVAKEPGMIQYLEKVRALASTFKEFSIKQEVLAVVEDEGRTWMNPIYEYLAEGTLLDEKKKERVVRRKAGRYVVTNGVIYNRSFLGPWLHCVGPLQANYVIREIHEGSCSMHVDPKSMMAKALIYGYYWPTMHMDAKKLIRECNYCQVHRPVPRNLQQNLTPIMSPWPFYKWGIDITGPFSEGPVKVKFLIVAIDYFTKWIEAKPVATITGAQVMNNLVEISIPTWRTSEVDMIKNDEALGINLDLLEEKKEQAAIQEAKSKAKMKNTIMTGFATQVSSQETSSTKAMRQVVWKMEANLELIGKDRMRSRKH
uniref:Reverse transcriptase domain-containing protein n=1 Tax=Tanacetum cinerariifolium TaxID=118510 RepID=A0A6L2JJB3_TANCI|nr:reverse transcriptase domain-containing protein [Tanacetum cinerariifolium]